MSNSIPSANIADKILVATPSRTIFALPYWIAQHNGYFSEEGLAPQLEIINNVETIKTRLTSATLHLALDSPEGTIINAYQGGRLRIIAGNARRPPLFIIAKPGTRSIADLKGATFGVLSLTEGSSRLITKIMAANGLVPNDYRVVAVGGAPTRWSLLQDGTIDAGLQPFPLSYQAEAAGFVNLGWAGDYEPERQFTGFSANLDWAEEHKPTVVRFLRALLRAQHDLTRTPQRAAWIAAEMLETPHSLATRAIADLERLGILDPLLQWSGVGLQQVFKSLQETGALPAKATFDVTKLVAEQYLTEARRVPDQAGIA